ncbi:MAG: hypothetical protein QMD13_00215 [Candidatus Bathyarchaeia archaeon]|nr:hypothetical protein [Candidatus Bathyarchaeia archaeon]MDI6903908.1 hypothetical protein [Candidatus Bathyarchaeia archaeon]
MAKKSMSAKENYELGKLSNRTRRAIDVQIKRFGVLCDTKRKNFAKQISKAEIPDFEDVLFSAFNFAKT